MLEIDTFLGSLAPAERDTANPTRAGWTTPGI